MFSIDLRGMLLDPAIRISMIRSLPVPTLLVDRSGIVRLVNAAAATLMDSAATGHRLSEWFTTDRSNFPGGGTATYTEVMSDSWIASKALLTSGWMRTVDSRWAAVDLRIERLNPIEPAGSHARVIVVTHGRLADSSA